MKKFLAIYTGTTSDLDNSGWNKLDENKRRELDESGIKAWKDWMAVNDKAVIDVGTTLGKTKRIAIQSISGTVNNITGYVIVQAESRETAARMFENHLHFTIFPGDSVEIMECLPLPGS